MTGSGLIVGLVGCGGWGKHILRDLGVLGASVEVVARSDESVGRAREGGATRVVSTVADLGEVDAVVVATPTSTHAVVLNEVIEREVPVYVEKPMVTRPEDAEALVAAAADRLFVMDKWRYHPGVEQLAELVRNGELGTVTQVQTRRLGWGNHHPDVDMFWTLAPHDLSIILEVLGRLPEATAAVGEVTPGGLVDFTGFLGDGPSAVVNVSSRHVVRDRSIRVVGTEAVATLESAYSETVLVAHGHDPDEADVQNIEINTEWPLVRELRAFLGHVKGGPPPKSSATDGALIVRRLNELRALAGLDR